MTPMTAAINDNSSDRPTAYGITALEDEIISSAVLVAAAFRLRDEDALITMLRRLTGAVEALESARDREE